MPATALAASDWTLAKDSDFLGSLEEEPPELSSTALLTDAPWRDSAAAPPLLTLLDSLGVDPVEVELDLEVVLEPLLELPPALLELPEVELLELELPEEVLPEMAIPVSWGAAGDL